MPNKKKPFHVGKYPAAKELNAQIEVLEAVSKDLKLKFDDVMEEMRNSFLDFLKKTIVHYETIRSSHADLYIRIITEAQRGGRELLESMDRQYADLKERCATEHSGASQPLSNIVESYSTSIKELQSQPDPDQGHLDRLRSTRDSAKNLHLEMEREYTKLVDEIERNFQMVRKGLILPELKEPTVRPLDVSPDLRDTAHVEVPKLFPMDSSGQPILSLEKHKRQPFELRKSNRISSSQVNDKESSSGDCWISKLCKKLCRKS